MQSARSLAIFIIVSSIAILTQTGCKENTILNANVVPASDSIAGYSTQLGVECKTIYSDSFITSNSFSGISIIHGLGTVNDPYFGRTNAGIYFQIVPPNGSFSFPAGVTYDSAVLILPYSGYTFGDTSLNINQKITAYRVTQNMYRDSAYYAFSTLAVDRNTPLGNATVNIDHLSDYVTLRPNANDTTTLASPHLRIKLDSNAFTAQINSLGTIGTQSDLLNTFKGIYLEADPRSNGAAIPYFYLDGSTNYTRAGVIFYYHLPGDTTSYSLPFSYTSNYCAHFNHISRNFRGTEAEHIIGAAPNNTDNLLLQNLPGCMMDVKIYGIRSLPRSLINKAQLIINRVPTPSDDIFAPPYRIYPIGVDSTGATYTIADGYPLTSTAPLAFIDGVERYSDGVSSFTHYQLNMPREIQAAIKAGRDTVHLHITGTTDFPGAFRLVAGGSNGSASQIRFNVVYSKN